VGRKEEIVSFLSPVLGGKENDQVETDEGDCAPDGIGEFHRLFKCPLQGPLVNYNKLSQKKIESEFRDTHSSGKNGYWRLARLIFQQTGERSLAVEKAGLNIKQGNDEDREKHTFSYP